MTGSSIHSPRGRRWRGPRARVVQASSVGILHRAEQHLDRAAVHRDSLFLFFGRRRARSADANSARDSDLPYPPFDIVRHVQRPVRSHRHTHGPVGRGGRSCRGRGAGKPGRELFEAAHRLRPCKWHECNEVASLLRRSIVGTVKGDEGAATVLRGKCVAGYNVMALGAQ
jgi:hypothetical protein